MDRRHRPPASTASRDLSSSYNNPPFRHQAPATSDAISNHRPHSTDAAREGPAHASHRRRISETPYYPPAARASFTELGHARAQSASSLQAAWQHCYAMPPQSSPPPGAQGQQQQQQHHPSQSPRPYDHAPRPPPLSVGPPNAFPAGGRDLPNLSSITRTGSSGASNSSMSISSMLGGPAPASRDSQPPQPPAQHYSPHGPSPTSAPGYPPSMHASPRMHSTSAEYPPFRRPQTPDHQRQYDHRGSAGSAGQSPHGPYSSTPDVPRFSTPQGYHQRHPSAPADTSREPGRQSAGPTASGGPPKPYSVPPRHDDLYARQYPYDDRYRERQSVPENRDREGRERAYSGGADSRRHHMSPRDLGRPGSNPHQPSPYGRPPDQREQRDQWGRPIAEPGYRAPLEHQRQHTEYPPTSAPYQPQGPPPYQVPGPDRYQGQHQGIPGGPPPPHDPIERARFEQSQQHHHMHRGRPGEDGGPPPPVPYGHGGYESPRKPAEVDRHGPNGMQRNLLALQDINRNKGRMSPLPQAVQGAQPQQPGPGAEPGIKSEFGRMFSGIGSGVGGVSSPVASGATPSFPNQGHSSHPPHREDLPGGDLGTDNAKGSARRRKIKDDDGRDDDSSGRQTPTARANKRSKPHQHHHHHHHRHHHHHAAEGQAAPPKALKGDNIPPDDRSSAHHHHHHHAQRGVQGQPPPAAAPVIPPKTKTVVSSNSVLDAVSNRPRHHLGDFVYESELIPGRLLPKVPTHRGFASNPKPLPWETIKGKENCMLTVKVPRIHLTPVAREEITARAFLWGTDVYSDDSDVIAACIHGGWIRGEWTDDVDTAMLELDQGAKLPGGDAAAPHESEGIISAPSAGGPMGVPTNRDLHVNVLILPRLSRYSSVTRYGITSREFGGQFGSRHAVHDGLSYMVHSIRWVENGAQPQARLRGKARRDRMRKAMREVTASFGNLAGGDADRDRGDITANWRKEKQLEQAAEENGKEKPEAEKVISSEGDKENIAAQATETSTAAEAATADVDMELEEGRKSVGAM